MRTRHSSSFLFLDFRFKLTSYERVTKPKGIDYVTSDYYLSYFANAAIEFSIPYIIKQEVRLAL